MSDDNKEGAGVPVAWWIPEAEQFCMNTPEGRPFAKHWEPLYSAPPAVMPAAPSDAVLAALDALGDEAAAHIYPSDLEKCMKSECVVSVASVRMGNPDERSVPLFSREQVAAALSQTMQPQAEPGDPMDWPLPCDVTVGHGTMRKGVSLRTLVMRMTILYEMATGNDADVVANRTPEGRNALADKFLAAIHDPRPLHEQIAEVRRQERPSAEVLNMVVGSSQAKPAAGEQAGAVADKLRAIELFAGHIRRTLDSEDFTAAKVPGLKDGLLYGACERAIFIQNAVKELRAALAAPGAAIAAREQESLLSDEELSLLQRVEQDMQMFSEGRYPYDSNRMPNQKWRRATIADVERRFKGLMPRFAALTTKLMNTSREEAPATPQGEPDPLLIDSMCMRWRHDFGLQRDTDDQLSSGFTDAERDSLRSSMRQLWEEVVGRGFYRAAALKGMQPGERKEGV